MFLVFSYVLNYCVIRQTSKSPQNTRTGTALGQVSPHNWNFLTLTHRGYMARYSSISLHSSELRVAFKLDYTTLLQDWLGELYRNMQICQCRRIKRPTFQLLPASWPLTQPAACDLLFQSRNKHPVCLCITVYCESWLFGLPLQSQKCLLGKWSEKK